MGKVSTLFALTMAVAVSGAARAAVLIETDFTKGANPGWVLVEGSAKIEKNPTTDAARPNFLSLTQDEGSQTGVAWTEMKFRAPSFSYIADVRIRHDDSLGCPADGFAMSFANVDDPTTVGGGGGAMGLFGGAIEQFAAFEINTWRGQGLGTAEERGACTSGKHVTFAFDVINADVEDSTRTEGSDPTDPNKGGAKIGQVVPPQGMTIVNQGWFRYQWNVAPDGTMTAYATGLEDANKQFQKVKVVEAKIAAALKATDFEGRFGLHAATGGAFQSTDVARVRIESPAVDPQ